MPASLRQIAFFAVAGLALLQVFGIGSGVDRIGLLFISIALLSAVMSSLGRGMQAVDAHLDRSESTHRHGTDDFRVFADASGGLWFRVADLRRIAQLRQTDRQLVRQYPKGFGEVNPHLEALYLHIDALRDLARTSRQTSLVKVSQWADGDLLGMQRFDRRMGRRDEKVIASVAEPRHWLSRHWHGQIGLLRSVFVGCLLVATLGYAASLIDGPAEITEHYQLMSALELGRLLLVTGALYLWARGVLYSAMRWVAADRSLWVALFACLIGFFGLSAALSQVMETDRQYLVTEFLTIVTDSDHKPTVRYIAEDRRIEMVGEMGFGTTLRARQTLSAHPEARTLELKSYGGRLAEGVALRNLIARHTLDTFVRHECMSACVAAFMGGERRLIAESAKIGLHRAGFQWQEADSRPSASDLSEADYMRQIGVTDSFIELAQRPSIHGIYEPLPKDVLASGLATAMRN